MTRSLEMGDRTGIVVAVACAIHCLAAPALAASMQMAGVLVSIVATHVINLVSCRCREEGASCVTTP